MGTDENPRAAGKWICSFAWCADRISVFGFLCFSTPFASPFSKVNCSKEQFINLQFILWLQFPD